LTDIENFRLSERGHTCQRARLLIEGRPVTIFNIHLETPFEIHPIEGGLLPFTIQSRAASARDREIDTLLELLEGLDEPCLVVGDFNAAAGTRPHRQLTRHLRDAFQEIGHGLGHTFPRAMSIYGAFTPM